jgi:hypothetical protein
MDPARPISLRRCEFDLRSSFCAPTGIHRHSDFEWRPGEFRIIPDAQDW